MCYVGLCVVVVHHLHGSLCCWWGKRRKEWCACLCKGWLVVQVYTSGGSLKVFVTAELYMGPPVLNTAPGSCYTTDDAAVGGKSKQGTKQQQHGLYPS
jgi:hypothetical protein